MAKLPLLARAARPFGSAQGRLWGSRAGGCATKTRPQGRPRPEFSLYFYFIKLNGGDVTGLGGKYLLLHHEVRGF